MYEEFVLDLGSLYGLPWEFLHSILNSMSIVNLLNVPQVVILDEAHNIEDSARSAASWEVAQEDVQVSNHI